MTNDIMQANYCVISELYGSKADYAKTELIKYILLLTGSAADVKHRSGCDYRITFLLKLDPVKEALGEEGYELHTTEDGRQVTISAWREQGLLYGVYGLLDEHYGVGFYFSGDAIPQKKLPLPLLRLDECKVPRQYIRGVLPWTNFPQSATSYSMQDWFFMIDQMTRMRMNFINIHNYNGELGHNEVFHNIMQNGEMSRNWNATVSKPHAWGMKGWDVNEYLFGGSELFDDYDFGADATLHNDCLGNIDLFKKGSSAFAAIIHYAHKRGVKIGLGLDLNLVTGDYGGSAGNTALAEARINQIITDYPQLDYLMLYRSENSPDFAVWNNAFRHTYRAVKERAANIRIAVSGWGLDPDTIIGLPADVIAAPISGHGVNDKFPDGRIYGKREFWACPWAERDYNDSVHFAPYHTLLSRTIACYQNRSGNTQGLMTLTWRLSDAVDAKLSYIAEAPWDTQNSLNSSKAAYQRYAERCYGADAAAAITEIINENEAYATNASECLFTPQPTQADRTVDIAKADRQLAVIDGAIAGCSDAAWRERLQKLRCRIQAVKSFCLLDMKLGQMSFEELKAEFARFVGCFIRRVDDISTLGNLFSVENRYVQEWFLSRAAELGQKPEQAILPDVGKGLFVLAVSPPTAVEGASAVDFKVIALNGAEGKRLTATLFWRASGGEWNALPMERRVKGIFGLRLPVRELPQGVIEYYVEATDGESTGRYPATAPSLCAALSHMTNTAPAVPGTPRLTACENGRLRWTPCDGESLWYRIYRGTHPDFAVGPQSLVTYVYRDTLTYWDTSGGFDGKPLFGEYYYKVSCVDLELREGAPSAAVCCTLCPPAIHPLEGVEREGALTLPLGRVELGAGASHLCVGYGSTGGIQVELRTEQGRCVGSAFFCSTGRTAVREVGEIRLTEPLSGGNALTLLITPANGAQWKLYDCYPNTGVLREPVITADSDSFAIGAKKNALRLFAEDTAAWSVKAMDGSAASGVTIHQSGLLTAECMQTVRAVSLSKEEIVRERLITALAPVREAAPDAFKDFWMVSKIVGCDERVEIGGLVNGYSYVCQIREGEKVIFTSAPSSGTPFQIPAALLTPGCCYEAVVSASGADGYSKAVSHGFQVTSDGLLPLNDMTLLGIKESVGSCVYTDEWNIRTEGRYEVTAEGLLLTTGEGDASARFLFRLPQPYTPELPHLLFKAESLCGEWTVRINDIPIVGPRENNIAVRKDLRTFGFDPGESIELMLLVSSLPKESSAATVFKSVQLLPDGK